MWMLASAARASRPCPETWSAWLWVSSTCSIRTPCRRLRRRYGSMSHWGSTTAATPAVVSPTTYEPHPRSSLMIWRKSVAKSVPAFDPIFHHPRPLDRSAVAGHAQPEPGDAPPWPDPLVSEDEVPRSRRDLRRALPRAGREGLGELLLAGHVVR